MAKAVKKTAAIQQLEELKEYFTQLENTYAVRKCANIITTLESDAQEVEFEEEPAIALEHVDPKDTLPLGTTDKIEEIANNYAFVSMQKYDLLKMNYNDKIELLTSWINNLDESSLDGLIEEHFNK